LKGKVSILLLVLFGGMWLSCGTLSAQSRAGGYRASSDNYHFGYISGGMGYTSLQSAVPDLTPKGGLGGLVGIGYEFRNNGVWLNVGAQVGFHSSEATMDRWRENYPGYDTQGKEIMLHYDIDERDRQKWTFVEVPVLVGWYFNGFHIGGGLKVSYAINTRVTASGTYDVSATNELYGIEFHDMPEHGYTSYAFEGDHDAKLNPLVSVIGEVGYDVLSSIPTRSMLCHVLRVSFYFEYGLNALVSPVSSNKRVMVDPNDATSVIVNPYFAAGMTQKYRVVPYYTGVKFTYLIGGSKTARAGGYHKGCHCYNH